MLASGRPQICLVVMLVLCAIVSHCGSEGRPQNEEQATPNSGPSAGPTTPPQSRTAPKPSNPQPRRWPRESTGSGHHSTISIGGAKPGFANTTPLWATIDLNGLTDIHLSLPDDYEIEEASASDSLKLTWQLVAESQAEADRLATIHVPTSSFGSAPSSLLVRMPQLVACQVMATINHALYVRGACYHQVKLSLPAQATFALTVNGKRLH